MKWDLMVFEMVGLEWMKVVIGDSKMDRVDIRWLKELLLQDVVLIIRYQCLGFKAFDLRPQQEDFII
ncbi:unnamed protein product [Trifolium pratense]|uniref:Uncharacterized protein n=1 Tax=Trifolium pratense TaxID=57577 RepID=A0ACB0ID79_TRIPR|nr:unnamed protein product [Trifolium pratense]